MSIEERIRRAAVSKVKVVVMTRYEQRIRDLRLSPSELADMATAEAEELARAGLDPCKAKDHAIKLQILRRLRDEATTPELPLFA